MDQLENKEALLNYAKSIHQKFEHSKVVNPSYYEPGMMENMDQYEGLFDSVTNIVILRVDSKGLRYENRTSKLDNLSIGDDIAVLRDSANAYNSNNFEIFNSKKESLGMLPADLCNALAPLVDSGYAKIVSSTVSYIESISKRSRYAKQGVLFVELKIQLLGI